MKKIFKATSIAVISFYLVFFIPTALAQVDSNNPNGTTTTDPNGTVIGNNTTTPDNGTTTGNNVITDNNTTTGNNTTVPDNGNNTGNNTGNNIISGNNTTDDYDNDTGTINNTTNDVVDDDNEVGDIVVYGAGGAVIGSLLTYFAIRGRRTERTV